jgi:preprotein translocase subunit SecD
MNRIVVFILAGFAGLFLLLGGLAFYAYRTYTARGELLTSPPAQGVKFTCELDSASAAGSTNLISEFREAARKRFARKEWRIHFEQASATKAIISAPIADSQQIEMAKLLLTERGVVEFRLVHRDNDQLVADESQVIPSDHELLTREEKAANGPARIEKIVVSKQGDPGLTGNVVKRAFVTRDNFEQPEIMFQLHLEATMAFANLTRQNIGRRLAIVLDGKLMTAPIIHSAIEGGSGMISGRFSLSEAEAIAAALESPLPASVKLLETSSY